MTARRVAVRGFTHGYSGYQNYGCRCDRCRAGNAEANYAMRQHRAARLAADPTLAPHGVLSTYLNWACRCVDCRAVRAQRDRDRRAGVL